MFEHLLLLLHLSLLSALEVEFGELLQLEPQVVLVGLGFGKSLFGSGKFVGSLTIALVSLAVVGEQGAVVGNGVEHLQLEILLREQEILVLGMYIDKAVTDLAQRGQRYG